MKIRATPVLDDKKLSLVNTNTFFEWSLDFQGIDSPGAWLFLIALHMHSNCPSSSYSEAQSCPVHKTKTCPATGIFW